MRVLKFGGKSLSTIEKVQKIAKFIKKIYKNDKKIIIIVSAMGKKTDELICQANKFSKDNIDKIEMAKLLSTGETESSALFAMALHAEKLKAKSFGAYELEIETFGDPLESQIAYFNKSKLQKYLNENTICIVAGFQGINKNGELTTLGRGGSDTTAVAIGAIFDVKPEIYSDFDGVFCGDPREFDFKKLKNIDFKTMKNMANAGAKVLDSRATKIAEDFNIEIISKNSEKPNHSGSIISNIETDIISIATINHLCLFSILFSNKEKQEFIIKNVLNCLKDVNFYNLRLEKDKLTFLICAENKTKILNSISKKLNLLKSKN